MQYVRGMDERPYDIQQRTFLFACEVVRFCQTLIAAHPVTRRLAWQLLDAATSIGANTEEADVGQTKRDFRSKIAISRQEARETVFWLRLIAATDPLVRPAMAPLLDEATQIARILTATKRNADNNDDRG